MGQDLGSWQTEDVLILERVTSIFSVVGCLFIFTTFILSKNFRRPVNRLIFFASIGNLLMNIATLMSVTPFQVQDPKLAPLCRFQGFLVQIFLPADALWNLSMAINVYLTVFKKWSAQQLRRLEPFYIAFNYGVTFIIALIFLLIDEQSGLGRGRVYGKATLWCWIDESWEGYRIWLCYIPAWVAIVAIFVIYAVAWLRIRHRRRTLQSSNFDESNMEPAASDIKHTEIRVTTELTRHSFVSPVVSPHMPTDEPGARRSRRFSSIKPSYMFNPFRLDPNCNRGFDPYSVTITRHEDAAVVKRRIAATEANAEAWAYTQTALLYFVSLLITWVPSSMNRVYSLINVGQVNFAFSIMAGVVLPLMGFWNAVIYIVTSWDAVKTLFSDIAHGRIHEFKLPRHKGRTDAERGNRGWYAIDDTRTNNTPEPDDATQRGKSLQSEVEVDGASRPKRGLRQASVGTAVIETSASTWPYQSKQEYELQRSIQGKR